MIIEDAVAWIGHGPAIQPMRNDIQKTQGDKNIMIVSTDHVSIQTNDFPNALHFYHEILGFPIIKKPFCFKSRELCFLQAPNLKIELYSVKEGEGSAQNYLQNRGGLDHIAFSVGNIHAFISYLEGKGVKIVRSPFRPPTGDPNQPLVSYIQGPDGQHIEIREAR